MISWDLIFLFFSHDVPAIKRDIYTQQIVCNVFCHHEFQHKYMMYMHNLDLTWLIRRWSMCTCVSVTSLFFLGNDTNMIGAFAYLSLHHFLWHMKEPRWVYNVILYEMNIYLQDLTWDVYDKLEKIFFQISREIDM